MVKRNLIIFLFPALMVLAGCATVPKCPSVMALPGPEKSFEQFQADDAICRQWAAQQIGLSPQETINQNTASTSSSRLCAADVFSAIPGYAASGAIAVLIGRLHGDFYEANMASIIVLVPKA
jgi:hypothetical protein